MNLYKKSVAKEMEEDSSVGKVEEKKESKDKNAAEKAPSTQS